MGDEPYLSAGTQDQPVSHVLIFPQNAWSKLRHVDDPGDVARVGYRVVELPQPMTLGEAFEKRAWEMKQ
jgi:hypothetical protein